MKRLDQQLKKVVAEHLKILYLALPGMEYRYENMLAATSRFVILKFFSGH